MILRISLAIKSGLFLKNDLHILRALENSKALFYLGGLDVYMRTPLYG